MKRIMVDLETLDIKDTAKILSIGAVQFDEGGEFLSEFYMNVEPSSYLYLTEFTESKATKDWWKEQDREARLALERDRRPVRAVLNSFCEWVLNIGPAEVWACPPSFDVTILETHFRKLGIPIPWNFWNPRCYRTLRNVFREYGGNWYPPEAKVKHNALEDAKAQAKGVASILGILNAAYNV